MRDLSRPSLNDFRANASHTSLQFAINRFAATDCGNLCASDDAAETVYIHGLQTTHLEIGMKGILIGQLSTSRRPAGFQSLGILQSDPGFAPTTLKKVLDKRYYS